MDRINGLSDDIICHILSFLSFKEATSTSVLSKRWRYLFAFRPNLHLDDHELGGGEAIPVFRNLFRLSITVDAYYYHWKLLPILLEKSPNLQTLVIKGPLDGDIYEREYGLSYPVKGLKITEYGGKIGELKKMKHFLEKLPCLELVKVRACAINGKEKTRITRDLLMVPRSSNCNIQIKFCENTK